MNNKPSPLPWILIAAIFVVGTLFLFNRFTRPTQPAATPPPDPVVSLSRTPRIEPTAATLPPLHAAAARGDAAALQALCAPGTEVDARDSLGRTPLMHACLAGNMPAVTVLLGAGASPSLPNSQGETALYFASGKEGSLELVRVLIEAGADVNAATSESATPLMRAAEAGDPARCMLLLDAGASPTVKDKSGRSALDRAKARSDDAGARCAAVLDQANP